MYKNIVILFLTTTMIRPYIRDNVAETFSHLKFIYLLRPLLSMANLIKSHKKHETYTWTKNARTFSREYRKYVTLKGINN